MASEGGTLASARPAVGWIGRARHRPVALAAAGLAALVIVVCLGVAMGSVAIAPLDTLAIVAHRLLGLDLGRTWSASAETIVWDLRVPRVLTSLRRRDGAGGRRGDLPGPPAQPARRSVRARHGLRRGARSGHRGAAPDPDRHPRVRPAPGPGLRRRARVDLHGLSAVADRRPVTAHQPAADRLRRRLAPRRRAGHGDVPVGRGPAPDLLVPAREGSTAPPGRSSPPRSRWWRSAPRSSSCAPGR